MFADKLFSNVYAIPLYESEYTVIIPLYATYSFIMFSAVSVSSCDAHHTKVSYRAHMQKLYIELILKPQNTYVHHNRLFPIIG